MAGSELEGRLTRLEESMSEVNVRLATLNQSVEGYRGNQEQMLMMMQRMVTRHDEQLNGYQDRPGMMVRMDRVEQRESARQWHIRSLWAAMLSFVAIRISQWLKP